MNIPENFNGFVETDQTLGWLDDDDGSKLAAAIASLKADGFTQTPYDHLPDEDKYIYAFYGPLLFFKPV